MSLVSIRKSRKLEEDKRLIEIVKIGRKHRQLGLFLYICYRKGVSVRDLHKFYNKICGHKVHPNTVSRQLKLLISKGLVYMKNGKVFPLITDPDVVINMFDMRRSHAGKRGAMRSLRRYLYIRTGNRISSIDVPENIKHYISKIVRKVEELVLRGRREVGLDLVVHTLLPLRKTGVLWLWRNDEFIYYEPKTRNFHCVKFPALAKLLRELGYKEGLMIHHVIGHRESEKIIRKLFGRGFESWPIARSIFYKLKQLGLAGEGSYYIVELLYDGDIIRLYLKDYFNNTINVYETQWNDRLPAPLDESNKIKTIAIGKQHINPSNENSYFSRWSS